MAWWGWIVLFVVGIPILFTLVPGFVYIVSKFAAAGYFMGKYESKAHYRRKTNEASRKAKEEDGDR